MLLGREPTIPVVSLADSQMQSHCGKIREDNHSPAVSTAGLHVTSITQQALLRESYGEMLLLCYVHSQ